MNHLTAALTAMRRSPYQSLAAILMISLTCFIAYTFSLFITGAQTILQYFETRPQVIGFFQLGATATQINEAKLNMEQKSYVTETTMVSKEQALEIYRRDNQGDPLLLDLVTAEILPASLEVSGRTAEDLPQIKSDLEALSGVDEAVYQESAIESLTAWTRSVRAIGVGSITILALLSFLIVMIIIGMKVTTKKPAIQIMRIIGATKWYIKAPFMIEGLLYGLIGSVVGWLAMFGGLLYLTPWLNQFLGSIQLLPVPPAIFALQLGLGTVIAMVVGGLAGMVAVQRLIKK